MKTLVIYDISDNRGRRELRETLLDAGLRHLQLSCYLGDLDHPSKDSLIRLMGKYIKRESDSIYVLPLCERCLRAVKVLSHKRVQLEEEDIHFVE